MLLEELKGRGHATIEESARFYTEKQLAKGLSLEQIRADEKAFQEAVFKHKQTVYKTLEPSALTFFDRGYHDTIAYLRYHGLEIAKFISDASKNVIYKKVFVLDMLPYVKDKARIEDYHTAKGLHNALISTYEEAGYRVIYIPIMPARERADLIEVHIH